MQYATFPIPVRPTSATATRLCPTLDHEDAAAADTFVKSAPVGLLAAAASEAAARPHVQPHVNQNRSLLEMVLSGHLSSAQANKIKTDLTSNLTRPSPRGRTTVAGGRTLVSAPPGALPARSHKTAPRLTTGATLAWRAPPGQRSGDSSRHASPGALRAAKGDTPYRSQDDEKTPVSPQPNCAQLKLREAIQGVVKQQQLLGKGENVIKVLRSMRAYDIHPGALITRIQSSQMLGEALRPSKDGIVEVAASAFSSTILPKRWPEIWKAIKQQVATGGADPFDDRHRMKPTTASHAVPRLAREVLIARNMQALAEADLYDALQFDAQSRGLREDECEAARLFDWRHQHFSGVAQRAMATLKFDVTSMPTSSAFRLGATEVARNRYVTTEVHDPFEAPPPQRAYNPIVKRRKRRWKLEESIWAPRRETGNSKDFYETPKALHALLMNDWQVARVHHQLAYFILRTQLPQSELSKLAKELHTEAPEVEAVYKTLERRASSIYGAFFHYAIIGKTYRGAQAMEDADIDYVRLNAFYEFVHDCGLVEASTRAGIDIGKVSAIWSIVDAHDRTTRAIDQHNLPSSLSRHEWLQVIVRLAVLTRLVPDEPDDLRKGKKGQEVTGNVADAVEAFCIHLEATLTPAALLNSNDFRGRHCYTEPIDLVLRQHEAFLRTLFASYAQLGNHGMNDLSKMASTQLMSVGEWLEMLSNLGLLEGHLGFFSVLTSMQAFAMSRIRSSKDYSNAQEIRLRQCFFEDFLEALVRLAYVIALPTFEELEESAAADAGDFLAALHAGAGNKFRQFVARRTGDWFGHPRQRVHRCLESFISLMTRMVQANAPTPGGSAPKLGGSVSRAQLAGFARRRHGGAPLSMPVATFDGSRILSVIQEIEAHNTRILCGVPAFSGLNAKQIDVLRDSMSVAKFKQGEFVFEQGDEGDAFYLITFGLADALRVDPNDSKTEEVIIGQLTESDCFGELALMRNEPRAASIMATTTLDVLFITRSEFELHLGPLSAFQLAEYNGVVHDGAHLRHFGVQMEGLAPELQVKDASQVMRELVSPRVKEKKTVL